MYIVNVYKSILKKKNMKKILSIMAIGAAILVSSCETKTQSPYQDKMDASVNTILNARNDSTGIWPEAGWWNSANVFTAVVRYADLSGKKDEFLPIIEDIFQKTKKFPAYDDKGNFVFECVNYVNDYYDDEGWWALAWIEAYKLTNNPNYLEMSEKIFADMTTGWSDDLYNGGIFWKKNPLTYKNSIANNLFALTAIRLYQQTKDKKYAEWFEKEVNWYLSTGMYNEEHMIEDGMDNKTGAPNKGSFYTYNQGVAMAVLAEMSIYKNDKKYMEMAEKIAESTMDNMVTHEGILCERNPKIAAGNDGVQFKGIFMRHLGFLYRVTGKKIYKDFMMKNADSIITVNYDPESKSFGCYWYGPFNGIKTAANSSALECVLEAEAMFRE